MQIDKSQIIDLLKSQGKHDHADQAQSELPDQVDLLGKIPGLGGFGG
jgi:hypothetical protein